MATLRIAFTFAHEIAHHVIATRGFVYDRTEKYRPWQAGEFDPKKEETADRYADEVVSRMCQNWQYKLGRWLNKVLSKLWFEIGTGEHWKNNYDRAAYWNFRAFMVEPHNVDAGYAYRHDMEILLRQEFAVLCTKSPMETCGERSH
jgi:hypothetical protein